MALLRRKKNVFCTKTVLNYYANNCWSLKCLNSFYNNNHCCKEFVWQNI